ncbi:MAG: polyprenyl synthetase family protein [Sedimentisphaerales bacterium]|nr:polyprenyl synthetase family protein [Sedimentisphaerales bacterium]
MPNDADFQNQLQKAAQMVEEAIAGYLVHDPGTPEILAQSMAYSLQAGGKRLRPVLVLWACRALGGQEVRALPAAAAIELVHTYSLIHDDLPAMDDDDIRRGKPTNHKVFGEGIALLAGDALLTYAFHILARHIQKDRLVRQLILELSTAAGAAGMIGGQAADLLCQKPDSRGNPAGPNPTASSEPDLKTVTFIHTQKTAMLFQAASRMGGWCAEAEPAAIDMLGEFGLKTGLAFQIIDDLLDITATTEQMGKRTQKDRQAGKLTYPAVVGLEQSRQQAQKLIDEAIADLADLGKPAEPLRRLARKISHRNQ